PVPATLLAAIDAVASERFGRGDLHGAALARAVQAVSAAYTRERDALRSLDGDDSALCARLRFFLPRDAPKIVAPLAELAAVGALPRGPELRVLDLGAGLGTTSLGAAGFLLAQPGIERLQIDAVDQDAAALELAQALCRRYARDAGLALEMKVQRAALTPQLLGRLAPRYQLIVLGFVLNELALQSSDPAEQHARWLMQLGSLLSDDGAIVVLEPALRPQSRALQLARAKLLARGGPPYLFAPCLHAGTCPMLDRERDWCHERLPLALPPTIAAIAREAGLREAELSYSYLTLCREPRSLAELAHGAPERLYRIVSAPLASKGKLELALCGPGGATRARRLDRHAGRANEALERAGRGQLLRFTGAEAIAQDGTLKVGDGRHVERVGPVS
ncbi:MAG TPA: small ribosomal subunit Rsm22 family protein, partial [Polyangiales bacterium]|nr:small ribosomal subunit Rsm22 family protein [Polyangiales bacterium]